MNNAVDGVWRTIGGRKVFIKNGQDLASALKTSYRPTRVKKPNQARIDELVNNFTDLSEKETHELTKLIEQKEKYNKQHNIKEKFKDYVL